MSVLKEKTGIAIIEASYTEVGNGKGLHPSPFPPVYLLYSAEKTRVAGW